MNSEIDNIDRNGDLARLIYVAGQCETSIHAQVYELLDRGVSPFTVLRGESAIGIAIEFWNRDLLRELLKHPAFDPLTAEQGLNDALRYAEDRRQGVAVVSVIARGATWKSSGRARKEDVDEEDFVGRALQSPLHVAAMLGMTEEAIALLEAGCDPESTDDPSRQTVVDLAMDSDEHKTAAAISSWIARKEALNAIVAYADRTTKS